MHLWQLHSPGYWKRIKRPYNCCAKHARQQGASRWVQAAENFRSRGQCGCCQLVTNVLLPRLHASSNIFQRSLLLQYWFWMNSTAHGPSCPFPAYQYPFTGCPFAKIAGTLQQNRWWAPRLASKLGSIMPMCAVWKLYRGLSVLNHVRESRNC